MPHLAWTTRNCPKYLKMAGANNGDEKIARILKNKNSRNTKGFICRLTFYWPISNIV